MLWFKIALKSQLATTQVFALAEGSRLLKYREYQSPERIKGKL